MCTSLSWQMYSHLTTALSKIKIIPSLHKVPSCPFVVSPLLHLKPLETIEVFFFFPALILLPFPESHINRIPLYVAFWIWLILHSICFMIHLCCMYLSVAHFFLLLNNTTFGILPIDELLVISYVWQLWIKLLWIFMYKFLYRHMLSFSWGNT